MASGAARDGHAINTRQRQNGTPERETARDLDVTGNPCPGIVHYCELRPLGSQCHDRPGVSIHSFRKEIRVWTRDLLIAIGLALVIIVFLYQPVKVEGTSMAPLLSDQE